ncbi:MAG TPA: M48 family metallopeptidase, partial [Gammaproteobacteria bacterium]|nr:M48 family metallopeptidase [Gammaproteobacteria bacterium]
MSYENPDVPHEVNVARENALVEFLRLLAGVGLVVLAVTVVLYFTAGWLARLVPFATERSWVGDRVLGLDVAPSSSPDHTATETYLRTLSDDLAAVMALPESMVVRVHYTDLRVPNAFATLGGHIVVTSELYRLMPSENALAMVLAHEIAHVKRRDPIAALGGGASVALVLAVVSGEADGLVPQVAALVALGYSRSAEEGADEEALAALIARYGHAGGAASVFEVLARQKDALTGTLPSFLSTHPADDQRIAN